MAKEPHETDIWVGTRVRVRRLEMGLSQSEVGHRLGITFQQVQKYEKGVNRIGASRLRALAGILEVPVGYFFPDPDRTESATSPAEVLDLLRTPGAVEILRDFARITNPAIRRAARTLLESLASAHNQDSEASSPDPGRPH